MLARTPHSLGVIGAPVSVKTFVMDTRPGSVIVLLTEGLIGMFAGTLIGRLADGMVVDDDGGRGRLAEVCMTVVMVVVIAWEEVTATEVRAETFFNTDMPIIGGVDVKVNVWTNVFVRTVIGVVSNIDLFAG